MRQCCAGSSAASSATSPPQRGAPPSWKCALRMTIRIQSLSHLAVTKELNRLCMPFSLPERGVSDWLA